jgi:hypothetical protein
MVLRSVEQVDARVLIGCVLWEPSGYPTSQPLLYPSGLSSVILAVFHLVNQVVVNHLLFQRGILSCFRRCNSWLLRRLACGEGGRVALDSKRKSNNSKVNVELSRRMVLIELQTTTTCKQQTIVKDFFFPLKQRF